MRGAQFVDDGGIAKQPRDAGERLQVIGAGASGASSRKIRSTG